MAGFAPQNEKAEVIDDVTFYHAQDTLCNFLASRIGTATFDQPKHVHANHSL